MDQIILNLSYGMGLQNTIGWFLPIFLGSVNVLSSILSLFSYAEKSSEFNRLYPGGAVFPSMKPEKSELYDFIVVGGGTSGSVVANRLSKKYKVLLLERGGEPNPLTGVPVLQSFLVNRQETDYSYLTVPLNQTCRAMKNQQSLWSKGKGLGGSSLINSMVYLRGHPYDYDIWAYWTKDDRWNYEKLVPFFMKSEDYCFKCETHLRDSPTNKNFHGSNGELQLRKVSMGNLVDEFLDAMDWAGVPRTDLNAPFSHGSDAATYTQSFGRRMSSRDAFLNPIRRRKNLKIIKYARVYKVLLDNGRAYGVEYENFGKITHAGVTKEVILSAGAIESPKILLLSGIGPEEHLKELEIPLVVNSPWVGLNLQDHIGTLLGPFIINQPISYLAGRNLNIGTAEEFIQNGTGPFTITSTQAISMFASSKSEFPDYPDIQISLSASGISDQTVETLSRVYNIKQDVLAKFYDKSLKNKDAFNLYVSHGRPKSRGHLKLKSSNPRDDPLIDPGYLNIESDLQILVEGLKKAVYIAENAPSLKNLKAKLSPIEFPGCEAFGIKSDLYFECLVREITLTLHHFSGTVRMGSDAGNSALDSELRVRGIENLRVIDTSAMPFLTTMGANGVIIAERGAQFIVDHYDLEKSQPIKQTNADNADTVNEI